MTDNKVKLYQKILTVQKILEPLEKTGRNDFLKYSYATAGDVLLPVQRACNAQGLILIADCIDSKIEPGRATVTVKLTVIDTETDESLSTQSPGYAEDWSYKSNQANGDKAVYKAITGGTKYAIRSFFCLPSEDDPERSLPKSINITRSTGALIDQTTVELKRLGWTTDQGRLYLQEHFDKSSRSHLTHEELQQFLAFLRELALPTPVLS